MAWELLEYIIKIIKREEMDYSMHYAGNSPYSSFDIVAFPKGHDINKPSKWVKSPLEVKSADPATAYKGRHGRGTSWICIPRRNGIEKIPSNGFVKVHLEDGQTFGHPQKKTLNDLFTDRKESLSHIGNLTQHMATPEQLEAGVIEPLAQDKEKIQSLLTFDQLPSAEEIDQRAKELASLTYSTFVGCGVKTVMIGGAPFFMSPLEKWLSVYGIKAVYAFSKREVTETILDDGSVTKKAVFQHIGFVPTN